MAVVNRFLIAFIFIFFGLCQTFAFTRSDIPIPTTDGFILHGDLYEPSPTTPSRGLVLSVHGLTSHSGWFGLGETLANRGFTVLAFDRRGSGRSPGLRGHVEARADFLTDIQAAYQFLNQLGPDKPFFLLANSLGALPTLHLAKAIGDRVSGIVFTTPGLYSTPAGGPSAGQMAQILFAPKGRYFPSPLESEDFTNDPVWLEWIQNDQLAARQFTAGFYRSLVTFRTEARRITNLSAPLLTILAADDTIIDNRATTDFVSRYRGPTELLTFPGMHYLFFGPAKDETVSAILQFLERNL